MIQPVTILRSASASLAATVLLSVLLVSPALAANKYWVGASGTTNAPTSGTWQTTTPTVWSDGTVDTANVGWTAGDTAYFSGADGTYAVTVGGAVSGQGISFLNSGYTLSAASALTVSVPSVAGSAAPQLFVGPGVTATIGTNVTVQNSYAIGLWIGATGANSGGTLNISGKVDQNSANTGGLDGYGTVVNVLPGGSLLGPTGSSSGGYVVGRNTGADCTVNVNGGTFGITSGNTTAMTIGGSGTGTVSVVSGAFTMSKDTGNGIVLGSVAGIPGILNLNGGVTTTPKISMGASGTLSALNFNGGTLKANANTASFVSGITTINVRNGGVMIDSQGFGITIGQALPHSAIAGDAAVDGGLTKLGTGMLTLNGTNTYTGATTVNEGTLALGGSIIGPVTVSTTGTLSGGATVGAISISNNLTLDGTVVMRIDKVSTTNDVIQGVTNLSYNGTLVLNLSNGTWAAGDTFTLFTAKSYSGSFTQITAAPSLAGNLTFDTTGLLTNGSLRVVPLTLKYVAVSNGLSVSWSTIPWYQYQLITTTNLAEPMIDWDDYGLPVIGTGGIASQTIPNAGLPQQFFSLKIMPSPIDSTRLPVQIWKDTQWNDPGGWITIDVTTQGLPANNTNIDAAVQIANIINNTSGRRRLYFPNGIYSFKSSLAVNNKSDLWFDGDGRSNTVFRIDAPGSANAEIGFYGGVSGSPIAVTGSLVAGDSVVAVADASTLNVGDLIQLYADNAPLTNGGLAFVTHIYGQMCKIVAKNGNTITLDMKALFDYPASYTPLVQRYNQIQNIKVSNLLISRVNEPTNQDVSNLEFFDAYNCYVTRVESNFSQRHHIYFQNSKDCLIESNYVHDCFVHTTGGYGYGYGLVGCTGCRISNNKSTRLRHHIILQIGANYNVASYNSTEICYDYNDMALHAAYAYMNLFEGNMLTESYADTSKDGSTTVEPSTGPENTWFRNYATGQVGCIQTDTSRQNVIGNVVGTLDAAGSDHYLDANLVAGADKAWNSSWTGGTTNWGVFNASVVLPASLYLSSRPTFFDDNTPWPVFGPGVANWGVTNAIPARLSVPTGN